MLKKERQQHRTRIQSLLFTQGIDVKVTPRLIKQLDQLQCWDGRPVPAVLLGGNHAEIARWRLRQALGRTSTRRPELLVGRALTGEERCPSVLASVIMRTPSRQ